MGNHKPSDTYNCVQLTPVFLFSAWGHQVSWRWCGRPDIQGSREVFPEGLLWARDLHATIIIKQLLFTQHCSWHLAYLTSPLLQQLLKLVSLPLCFRGSPSGKSVNFPRSPRWSVTSESLGHADLRSQSPCPWTKEYIWLCVIKNQVFLLKLLKKNTLQLVNYGHSANWLFQELVLSELVCLPIQNSVVKNKEIHQE